MEADLTAWLYWLLSLPTLKGVVFGGLLVALVLPALLELFNWRRG